MESATSTTVIELLEHIIVISTLVTVFTARVGEHNFNVIIIKIAKYSGLEDKCIFQPIAVQSLGPLNETACQFLKDLGRRISAQSGDDFLILRPRYRRCLGHEKINKYVYATLQTHYDFQPIAVETLGPVNESATSFLYDLGRRILLVSGEDTEPQFLFQRISVAIQRFNAVLLHDGFLSSDYPPTNKVCSRL